MCVCVCVCLHVDACMCLTHVSERAYSDHYLSLMDLPTSNEFVERQQT